MASLMFALGTSISDYAGTAIIASIAGFIGVCLLWLLDRTPKSNVKG